MGGGGGGGGETATASAFLEKLGSDAASKTLTCALCGKERFRSPEELGTHSAICFGNNTSYNDETVYNGMMTVNVAAIAADVLNKEVWHDMRMSKSNYYTTIAAQSV